MMFAVVLLLARQSRSTTVTQPALLQELADLLVRCVSIVRLYLGLIKVFIISPFHQRPFPLAGTAVDIDI